MHKLSSFFIVVIVLFSGPFATNAGEKNKTVNEIAQKILIETKSSERWEYIGQTKHGYVGFLDIKRLDIDGSYRNAWTKVIYLDEGLIKDSRSGEYNAVYTITNRIYDCYLNRVSDIKSIDYEADGKSHTTDFEVLYRAYPEKKWIDIIPGSLGEYLLKFICSYKS